MPNLFIGSIFCKTFTHKKNIILDFCAKFLADIIVWIYLST